MSIGLTLNPRILWDMWRMAAHLDGITPFKPSLPHPFSEGAQQQIVDPVIRDNCDYYSQHNGSAQVGAGLATSVFQTATMAIAGTADMAGAVLTQHPAKSSAGLFADIMNMVFSLGTRAAKMTTQGIAGDSVFDRTFAVANLTTEVLLTAEGLRGMNRGATTAGRHLNVVLDHHLTPAPALALVDGGLMMATDNDHAIVPASSGDSLATTGGKVIEAELDHAAQSRKAALDEDLQVPVPSMRATALTGTLEVLAQAGDWDDFVYAAGHAFDAIADVTNKESALQLRQDLAGEMANLMPDDAKLMPSLKVRGQLNALIERELPAASRNAKLFNALKTVQDKLAGWERVARERTPDTPLPATLRAVRQSDDGIVVRWLKKIPGVAWLAGAFAVYFKPTADAPQLSAPADFSAIGPCRDGFAYIPAGSFAMGSKSGQADEQPLHKVELDAYCMARTATTNKAYWDIMSKSPSPVNFDAPLKPVVNVNWQEAHDYCQAIGGSLPTEAQWERAAKGPEGHPYGTHSGTLNKNEANYNSKGTMPVGYYPPNGYGLYEMTGNVWEWSRDWYHAEAYASHAAKNPTGPEGSGQFKVRRGGSWRTSNAVYLRVAYRRGNEPDERYDYLGFRCVVLPEDSPPEAGKQK